MMNATPKKAAFIATIGVAALALSSCAGAAVTSGGSDGGDVEEIVIGALHPLSGANAVDGQQMSYAAQMAVDEVNEAGGIACLDGATLKLEAADTKGEPETDRAKRLA